MCYTEKATQARHHPECQYNAENRRCAIVQLQGCGISDTSQYIHTWLVPVQAERPTKLKIQLT